MSIQRVAIGRLARSLPPSERGAFVLFVVLLVRAGCAFAEEPASSAQVPGREPPGRNPARLADAGFSFTDVAPKFQLPSDYSPREYRALGPTLPGREPRRDETAPNPTLHASSAWERLADFRTRGGIRLLTIWNSKFNSLSLQTGRGGIPSLQWTSSGFGGGSSTTRGVLDRLLATGIDRFDVFKHAVRPVAAAPSDHPLDRRDN